MATSPSAAPPQHDLYTTSLRAAKPRQPDGSETTIILPGKVCPERFRKHFATELPGLFGASSAKTGQRAVVESPQIRHGHMHIMDRIYDFGSFSIDFIGSSRECSLPRCPTCKPHIHSVNGVASSQCADGYFLEIKVPCV
jgi:hypothetical protein